MERFGWRVATQRGSHRKLHHPDRTEGMIVAFHGSISGRLARNIVRSAGIAEDEFLDAL